MSANPITAEHEKAGVLALKPTVAQLNSACMSFRHDFGLMSEHEQDRLRATAKYWLEAWQKEVSFSSPSAIEGGSSGLPRVKALEWVERPWARSRWAASSTAGDYFVSDRKGFGWHRLMEPSNPAESVEAAKAAAQADYEARILAALDLSDPDADPKAVDAAARSIEPGKDEERLREALEQLAVNFEAYASDQRAATRWQSSRRDKHECNVRAAVYDDCAEEVRSALSPSRGEADTSQDRAAATPEGEE